MQESKFASFCTWVGSSWQEVVKETADLDFVYLPEPPAPAAQPQVIAIMGMVGKNPGRIIFSMEEGLAERLADQMNGEALEDPTERYLYLAELSNMVCGHAVTAINNHFPGTQVRLTPPAIVVGENLDVTTPSVQSRQICFVHSGSHVTIDVGFEGV